MTIDMERILQKITFIKEQIYDIESLTAEKSRTEILGTKIFLKGLKYSLQTAIESMIDIAFHIAVKKYNYAPEETRDAFRILRRNGCIKEEEYKNFSAMVGFRNRVVHLYQTVSDERVYEFSISELDDFKIFIARIKELLENE